MRSSVHAHVDPATGDGITDTAPALNRVGDFAALLRKGEDAAGSNALRRAERIGWQPGQSRQARPKIEDKLNALSL